MPARNAGAAADRNAAIAGCDAREPEGNESLCADERRNDFTGRVLLAAECRRDYGSRFTLMDNARLANVGRLYNGLICTLRNFTVPAPYWSAIGPRACPV